MGDVETSSIAHRACQAENYGVDTSAPGGLLRQTDTEASTTEEPREGTLHAGIWAGGAGRPAFLPRRVVTTLHDKGGKMEENLREALQTEYYLNLARCLSTCSPT